MLNYSTNLNKRDFKSDIIMYACMLLTTISKFLGIWQNHMHVNLQAAVCTIDNRDM